MNAVPKHMQHGHAKRQTRTYRIWKAMRTRCTNPRQKYWANYGGRGIKVCRRWNSFANFLADMGECPPGLTLGRTNNDGNYTPSNCAWVTWREQVLNRSRIKLTWADARAIRRIKGRTQRDIAAEYGIDQVMVSMILLNKTWKREDDPHAN